MPTLTADIIELGKKANYGTRELYQLAHDFELTHPDTWLAMLKERLLKGHRPDVYEGKGLLMRELRSKVLGLLKNMDPDEEKTLRGVIKELESKLGKAKG